MSRLWLQCCRSASDSQQLATRRLVKSGLFDTVVVVTSRRDLRNFNRGDDDNNAPSPADSPALDEPARAKIAQMPNVVEAYPDLRFITSFTFDSKPHLTMVAGIPASYKANDAFEGMQGSFFTSDTAPEVILQKSFAAELLGKTAKPGSDEIALPEIAKPLAGKEMTMRYSERVDASELARPMHRLATHRPYSHPVARTPVEDCRHHRPRPR